MPVASWSPAPEVDAIGRQIIEQHHQHLVGYPVRFVFRTPRRVLRGSECLGTAEIISGRFAHFVMNEDEMAMEGQDKGPRMFWIEISLEDWEESLSAAQQRALVDHELMHCDLEETEDGDLRMTTRPHDIEEFNEIVKRHGLWKSDLWEFGLTVAEAGGPSG